MGDSEKRKENDKRLKVSNGLKHTIWSVLDSISYPIVYFVLVRYLMGFMGPVVFGFWTVLGTVIVVLQLFNFNLGYTAMRHIAHERAAGSSRNVTDIINSLLVITFFQFLGIVVVGCVLSVLVAETKWLTAYAGSFQYGPLCFLLAAILGGLKYFEQVFQNIVKSYEHFKGAAIMNMIYRVGTLSATVIIAAIYPHMIVYVLLGNIFFSFCYLSTYYAYMCRVLSFYKATPVQETGLIKRLLHFSVWPWIQTIIIVSTFQVDRFWVSGYAGLQEVAAYGFVATMFNHINIIFTAMVAWMSPRIIGMYARAENPHAEYHFTRSLLAIFTIGTLLVFYWLSPVIFSEWMGVEKYEPMKPYIQGFTAFEIAFVHTIMPFFYLNGTGKEKQATYLTLICCVTCYLFMLGGLWIFHSPVALVRGMTIGVCLTVPLFNIASNKYIAGKAHEWNALLDMIPVAIAIGLVYTSSPVLMIALILIGAWSIWKYYFIHLNNRDIWRQVLGTGRRVG